MRKQFKTISAVFLSIIITVLSISCSNSNDSVSDKNMKNTPDEQSDSVHVVAKNGNKLEYILDAKHYRRYHSRKLVKADTIRVQTYNEQGEEESVLTADQADMDENRDILIARNHVKIVAESGILNCSYLSWDRKTDRIYARGRVILERENNVITGYELKTDINLYKIEMIKVSAQGKANEKDVDY